MMTEQQQILLLRKKLIETQLHLLQYQYREVEEELVRLEGRVDDDQ